MGSSAVVLHVISGWIIGSTCICAAVAIAWFARKSRGPGDDLRRVAWSAGLFVLAVGITRVIDGTIGRAPDDRLLAFMEAATAVLALVAAIAIGLKWPGLLALSSSRDRAEAGGRHVAERGERVETSPRLDAEPARVARLTRELAEAKQRLEVALSCSHVTVSQQDEDLRYTWVHNPAGMLLPERLIGLTPEECLPQPAAQTIVAVNRRVLETGIPERFEVALRGGDETHWFDERVEPLSRDGRISGVVSVAVDITPQKQYELHLRDLLREITHRSKNLLSVVQGIARQTAETVETLPDFITRFGARLQALSGAHELLVGQAWHGAEVRELIAREFSSEYPALAAQVALDGERELLGPEAAQYVALAIHEMATNASVHGALSVVGGSVDVSWRRVTVADQPMLELVWSESGGPLVFEPLRRGFGRTMVERLVPRAVEGTSEIVFDEDGLHWTLRLPLARLGGSPPHRHGRTD